MCIHCVNKDGVLRPLFAGGCGRRWARGLMEGHPRFVATRLI